MSVSKRSGRSYLTEVKTSEFPDHKTQRFFSMSLVLRIAPAITTNLPDLIVYLSEQLLAWRRKNSLSVGNGRHTGRTL
jgi:hypothetical protein